MAFSTPVTSSFLTPEKGFNTACISLWDNFPENMVFDIPDFAEELAVFLIGVTNPMQSHVENGRFTVTYKGGHTEVSSLINPTNFDDWLGGAVQTENETVYFSDYNHGIVQRIPLNPSKKTQLLEVRAIANEVVIGILGISFR